MRVRASVIFLSSFLSLCLIGLPSIASDKAKQERELKALQAKIGKLQNTIDVKQNTKSAYLKQLKNIEQSIGQVSQKIRASKKGITDKESELKKLRQSKRKNQQQLSSENTALAQQVYSAFTLGKQEKVKLLFSQQDAGELQRNLVYYQYFSNARVDLINRVQTNINQILKTEADINQAKKALEAGHRQLTEQKDQLKADSSKRKTIVASLDTQLKKQGGFLDKLQGDAKQLQSLIESIEEILDESPEPRFDDRPFAKLRGELAWPVTGKINKLYGRQKQQSELRWQGIIIEAPTGRHVRAISGGRVAFADWLRGLGNIIIIDHGNSYLSLYGHNEALFKSAGEWVEAGDIISSIGNSGGQKKPGLYFEIRKKGKPQNPTKWCKNGKQFSS
ncbi:MAG: septal ring factor EnvC (AmiA/AmiB activator) [Gammaproteobacteria bacterium]|jgi:septal ring factor EnvC (AmiA/AmiB activator)